MQPPRPPDTFTNQGQTDSANGFDHHQDPILLEQEGQTEGMEYPEQGVKPSRLPSLLSVCLALVAVLFLLRYKVFAVSNLRIEGIRHISWTEVAKASGLDRGVLFFTVKEDEVKRGINANRYLHFLGMEKVFPNTIELYVQERQPTAFFTHLGMGYVLSEDGVILEETKDLQQGARLMKLTGLSVWGQPALGAIPTSTDPAQMEILKEILQEIKVWGFEQDVASIDISQSMNLSLITQDGFTIYLGNESYLYAKIGTVQSVIQDLRRRQKVGGIIEAAKPGEVTYRDANQ